MKEIETLLIEAAVNGILVSGIIGFFILKRDEKIKNTIQEEFKKRDIFFNAQFDFKQRSVEELLGPVMMQLKRSSITVNSYKANDSFREAIIKECNENIRGLLLTKSFLIPSSLQADAADFIKHYDGWLQTYHELRVVQNDKEKPFVFTFDFPHRAEENFLKKYAEFRKELMIEEKLK